MLIAHMTRIRNARRGSRVANLLAQHDGATRWTYNTLLANLKNGIDATPDGELWPSIGDLAKTLRKEKPVWWVDVDWEMLDNGRRRLQAALTKWSKCRKGQHTWHKPGTCGFPKFHKRGDRATVSFSSHVGDGRRLKWMDQRHIILPRIGTITLAEPLPEVGWVKEVHAVRAGGNWYAVLVYENGRHSPEPTGDGHVVGVDVGINVLAYTSDGLRYDNPRWLKETERALRRINKAIARSIKLNPHHRTKRRERLYAQRARLLNRQANQRKTHHRQTASAIAKSANVVVMESLNVAGLMRNHRLAKALSDAGMGYFLRELEWQCAKHGTLVLKAGPWFPSTQLCSQCGHRPDQRLDLSVRTYNCPTCSLVINRDENAAINLRNVAPALWATLKGRGDDVRPAPELAVVSEASIGSDRLTSEHASLPDREITSDYRDYVRP